MKVYIVLRMEANEGGNVVFVSDTREKADRFTTDHPLHSIIEYYELEEWGVL